jgi:4-hydroxybenzoate polyprenyltransferase
MGEQQVTARLRMFWALSRPAVFVLLALYAALGLAGTSHAGDHLLLGRVLVPVAAFLVFSVACNDLADERIDRVNLPGDPQRPLVGGSVLRREMTVVAAVAAPIAVAGGFLLGPWPGAVVLTGLAISAGYSLPPTRLADRGAAAALTLPALYVAVPYLVGRLAAAPRPGARDLLLLPALYVGFVGRILLKDFRDVRGDALFGKRTFLVRHGRVATCWFSACCWVAGTGLLLAAVPGLTPSFAVGALLQLAVVLLLLRRLAADAHPRREEVLISAVAILGRGLLVVLLAQLSMCAPQWTALGQSAVVSAVVALSLVQAAVMLRHGPAPGRYAPAAYRAPRLPEETRV